jgi:hypothetical protein
LEEQQGEEEEEEEEEEEWPEDIMEGDVLASTQPSTLIDNLIHLLLHTPVVIHYQIQGLLLLGVGLTNNPLSFLVKWGEADIDIR